MPVLLIATVLLWLSLVSTALLLIVWLVRRIRRIEVALKFERASQAPPRGTTEAVLHGYLVHWQAGPTRASDNGSIGQVAMILHPGMDGDALRAAVQQGTITHVVCDGAHARILDLGTRASPEGEEDEASVDPASRLPTVWLDFAETPPFLTAPFHVAVSGGEHRVRAWGRRGAFTCHVWAYAAPRGSDALADAQAEAR